MNHFKQEKSSLSSATVTGSPKDSSGESGVEVKAFQPRSFSGNVVHSYDKTREQFGSLAATDTT
jgi:hypothetical protein